MTARLPDPARSRAVLIGTSSYADPELSPLPSVGANLTDLAGVLTAASGTRLPAAHCTVLADPPDAGVVGEALARAADAAEDLLLVYYAGHGLTWTSRNELYLALGRTRTSTVGTSALRCADVRQTFLDSAARTRVLILDCCFSGRAIEAAMASPADALLGEVDVEGAYVLTATEPNQAAQAPTGQRNTLFTGELLALLRNGIPDQSELLTLDLLYRQLKASLGRRNLPVPTCNNRNGAAHLALAGNPAARRGTDTGDLGRLQEQIAGIERLRAAFPDRRRAIGTGIDAVATAETMAEPVWRAARDKIAVPRLPDWNSRVPALRERVGELDRLADSGEWTRLADQLSVVQRECAEVLEGIQRLRDLAQGQLDRRAELRGRLEVYRAMAVRLRIAEDAEVATRHGLAHDLLWTKPCDLNAATRAVVAHQQAVTERRAAP